MQIGLIGLGVMGKSLTLNMLEKGIAVSVFNRNPAVTASFLQENKHLPLKDFYDLENFILSLSLPRKIILMIPAGSPVDSMIKSLLPLLSKEDIIIDGGNSYYKDTIEREKILKERGIYFIGLGISGGESGARTGPSLMAGGDYLAYESLKPILSKIAAKRSNNEPCEAFVGENGAGHYVKMIHNGIEYAEMQAIADIYHFIKNSFPLSNLEIAKIFQKWQKGESESYLIDITAKILSYKEGEDFLIDKVLDVSYQKGTGKWTLMEALELDLPAQTLAQAVFSRFISSLKGERERASKFFKFSLSNEYLDINLLQEKLYDALLVARVLIYSQGFMLLEKAKNLYNWSLDLSLLSSTWQEGCIIKSAFLKQISLAFNEINSGENLIFSQYFSNIIKTKHESLRDLVSLASKRALSLPTFFSALNFLDSYTTASSQANLIQAQRDFFGSHTFERIDKKRGEFFHSSWQ